MNPTPIEKDFYSPSLCQDKNGISPTQGMTETKTSLVIAGTLRATDSGSSPSISTEGTPGFNYQKSDDLLTDSIVRASSTILDHCATSYLNIVSQTAKFTNYTTRVTTYMEIPLQKQPYVYPKTGKIIQRSARQSTVYYSVPLTCINPSLSQAFVSFFFSDDSYTMTPTETDLCDTLSLRSDEEALLEQQEQLAPIMRPTRDFLARKLQDAPDQTYSVSIPHPETYGIVEWSPKKTQLFHLQSIYGKNSYTMTYSEIAHILDSHTIFTGPSLPPQFYYHFKQAMKQDQIVTLPVTDERPMTLQQLQDNTSYPHTRRFLQRVATDPKTYGFTDNFPQTLQLTLYELGYFVVKREDFHVFLDHDLKIISRDPDPKQPNKYVLRLISMCGVRCLPATGTDVVITPSTIKEAFLTAFQAAESGFLVLPSMGMWMGDGRGDLTVYWRAFFEAVATTPHQFTQIFVNPRSEYNPYEVGFTELLAEIKLEYRSIPDSIARLDSIYNVATYGIDMISLARRLKASAPNDVVSLFNASHPDCTLGFHVGGHIRHGSDPNITEAQYTAMGSHGLCVEENTDALERYMYSNNLKSEEFWKEDFQNVRPEQGPIVREARLKKDSNFGEQIT